MHDDDDDLGLEPPRPWWRRLLGLAGTVLGSLLVVAVVSVGVGRLRAPSLPGEAPPFIAFDLEGNQVSLADYRGRTVVLNFWATWCGPCRYEAPSLASFADAHPDIPVLGLAIDGPPRKVGQVAADIGMTYPVVTVGPRVSDAYKVEQLPTTVVVGPEGQVRWVHAGMMFRPQLAWVTGHLW